MQYVERYHVDPNSRQIGTAALTSQPAFKGNGLCEERWVLSDKIYLFICTVLKKKKLVRLSFALLARHFESFVKPKCVYLIDNSHSAISILIDCNVLVQKRRNQISGFALGMSDGRQLF